MGIYGPDPSRVTGPSIGYPNGASTGRSCRFPRMSYCLQVGQFSSSALSFRADTLDQASDITETMNLINDLALVANNQIIAAGCGAVLRSTDNGKHWEFWISPATTSWRLTWSTCILGYMVGYGGSIFRTEDGWQSWSSIRNGDALSVSNIPFGPSISWMRKPA